VLGGRDVLCGCRRGREVASAKLPAVYRRGSQRGLASDSADETRFPQQLRGRGIRGGGLNSTLSADGASIMAEVEAWYEGLLYVSPERFSRRRSMGADAPTPAGLFWWTRRIACRRGGQ